MFAVADRRQAAMCDLSTRRVLAVAGDDSAVTVRRPFSAFSFGPTRFFLQRSVPMPCPQLGRCAWHCSIPLPGWADAETLANQ
jgi:hypothetical protein